jgi:hypothetical protein
MQKGICWTNWKSFNIRYNEHKQAFRNNSHISSFAKHLNGKPHSFGTIHTPMQVLQYHKKGAHINTTDRFHIHAEFTANKHLNDDHTIFPNAIFDTLLKPTSYKTFFPFHNPENGHTPTLQYKTLLPLRIKIRPFHKKQRTHTHTHTHTQTIKPIIISSTYVINRFLYSISLLYCL